MPLLSGVSRSTRRRLGDTVRAKPSRQRRTAPRIQRWRSLSGIPEVSSGTRQARPAVPARNQILSSCPVARLACDSNRRAFSNDGELASLYPGDLRPGDVSSLVLAALRPMQDPTILCRDPRGAIDGPAWPDWCAVCGSLAVDLFPLEAYRSGEPR